VVFLHEKIDLGELATRLQDFEIIVAMRERTPFAAALLERLPRLRLLVTTGMRNASIDMNAAAARGIAVCGTPSLNYPTAELAFGHILSLARHIPMEDRALRAGQWQTTLGIGLQDKMLGVIGLGTLGSRIAGYGRAFGMQVLAWSQNLTDERAQAAGASRVPLDELLQRADFVSIHLVLSERTRGLIGAEQLARMKPSACLVNTSRAPIVDYAALVDALKSGRIAGAGLDVYDDEPLPRDAAIRNAPNTVLTPHLGYVTAETYNVFYGSAVEDIEAFLRGTPVRVLNQPAARA
jgi:phosphoglycerate dehydrogenase-like enzyme